MPLRPLAAALLLGATPLAAQGRAAAAPAARFGLLAGLNSATLAGENALVDGGKLDRHTGFVGGVYLEVPLGASGLAFRPELLYAQKGVRYRMSSFDPQFPLDLRATVRLSYVEAPLLLQYTVPTAGRLRPQLYGGPALAVRTGCRFVVRVEADTPAETTSIDCDNPGLAVGADGPGFRRLDVGGVVGGALAFGAGGRALTVGARYTHGLRRIAANAPLRNRAFAVYASLELPIRRREDAAGRAGRAR